jgi:hypothetical protein
MASNAIVLSNGVETKKAYMGYSWTMMFFGWLAPLFRGDWFAFFITLIGSFFTLGITNIVIAFFWNKDHFKRLLASGYRIQTLPFDITEEQIREWLGVEVVPMVESK